MVEALRRGSSFLSYITQAQNQCRKYTQDEVPTGREHPRNSRQVLEPATEAINVPQFPESRQAANFPGKEGKSQVRTVQLRGVVLACYAWFPNLQNREGNLITQFQVHYKGLFSKREARVSEIMYLICLPGLCVHWTLAINFKIKLGWGLGVLRGMETYCFMGTQSHHRDEEEALDMDSGDGYSTMRIR